MANWGTELRGNPAHQPKLPEETDQTRTPPAATKSGHGITRRAAACPRPQSSRSPLQSEPVESKSSNCPRAPAASQETKSPRTQQGRGSHSRSNLAPKGLLFFQGPGGVGRGAARGERRKASGCGSPLLSPPLNNEAQSKRGDGERGKGRRGIRRIKIEAFAALRCAALLCVAPRPRLAGSRPAPQETEQARKKKSPKKPNC